MPPADGYNWPHRQFRAMGGLVDLWLDVDDQAQAEIAFTSVEELFNDVERALSRFDSASELTRLNARSGQRVTVSRLLWQVLEKALDYATQTGGLFDPTLQRALKAAGYDETFERVQARQTPAPMGSRHEPGRWQDVEMFEADQSVRFPPGVELDFGGIGKGYTAGWAAALLGVYGPALVDAAGDIAAGDAPRGMPGWPVGIKPPIPLREALGENAAFIWLRQAGLATSGVDVRHWQGEGTVMHHIIDPRTGQPAKPAALTSTVLAPSMVEAEVMATAALIEPEVLEHSDRTGLLLFQPDGQAAINESMREQLAWLSPAVNFANIAGTQEIIWLQ